MTHTCTLYKPRQVYETFNLVFLSLKLYLVHYPMSWRKQKYGVYSRGQEEEINKNEVTSFYFLKPMWMRARSTIPWSCVSKLYGTCTSFLLEGGLVWVIYVWWTMGYELRWFYVGLVIVYFTIFFSSKYFRYSMVSWCMCFMSILIYGLGIWRCSSSSTECSWMAPGLSWLWLWED